jgi:hypothetical protein
MDGSKILVKILEIAPNEITYTLISESGAPFINDHEKIATKEVVLIEYKNGRIEVYNLPKKSLIYNANGTVRKELKKGSAEFAFNFVSLNTLGLCNADISVFFERLIDSKRIGYGVMGAYNFNHRVISPNLFLSILHNAKKNYDLGAFVNLYTNPFKRRTTFYMGILFKYLSFNYSKVIEEVTPTGTNIKYIAAKGSQFSPIFNVGTHSNLKNNFVFKTIVGIGGYALKGDFKQQYNLLVNKNNDPGTQPYNYSFLPKIYLGLNLGFSF